MLSHESLYDQCFKDLLDTEYISCIGVQNRVLKQISLHKMCLHMVRNIVYATVCVLAMNTYLHMAVYIVSILYLLCMQQLELKWTAHNDNI